MSFWTTFIEESLQKPWFVKPESAAASLSEDWPTDKLFFIPKGLPDPAYKMLGKMVSALSYRADEVCFVEETEESFASLESLNSSKKILFFGNSFPGRFGEVVNWSGHLVIQTHGVSSLMNNPSLKKETWAHLKMFASLK